jgi:type IV pilus assembly protein PilB
MGNPILHPVPEEDFVDPSSGIDAAGRVPLGRLLVGQGLITEAQLDNALFESSQTGERLGEIVVRLGLASEEEVAKALAEQWSLSYVDRASIWFDGDALARLSREDAQRLEALPTRVQDGRVVVAVAEPTEQRLDALREVIGEETVVVVVPRSALDAGLSSGLLASRSPEEPVAEEALAQAQAQAQAQAPPPLVFEAPAPPPVPPFEPTPASALPSPAASDDLEWFRERVQRLEAELAKQRAVTVEVQLHLQAALRTLLLNDVGHLQDHSDGGGSTA